MFNIIYVNKKNNNFEKGEIKMSNKLFMIAQEVADTLGMSKAYAYKL